MTRYEAQIDTANPNLSHTQVIELVGQDKKVLDVGCATGYLARQLIERGCTVSGVEVDPEAAREAEPVLSRLVVGDLNQVRLSDEFTKGEFDVVVFADVLEHVLDPAAVLSDSLEVLAADGTIVVSIPNVAHGSLRLALLQGRWDYTDVGLLDRTHLKFFTFDSLVQLLADAGLVIEVARSTTTDPLNAMVDVDAAALPATIVEWVRHQPHALDFQFVLRARRPRDGEEPGMVTTLEPAAPDDEVRLRDVHTERMEEDREVRYRLLTIRDHIIGLEAAVVRANAVVAHAQRATRQAELEAEKARTHFAEAMEDRKRMQESATWRVGSLVLRPVSTIRPPRSR
ncbi:class I SAM-dependent methyltransferase [Sanguibacter antarcticus]|uniref:Methyltransferase family protein n=1 Tax=Sanguibacter antarcticus TaxID=372484 RepID=A0A2A9E0Y8_9MICO|nr:class I SAM-dependent methyltransferase [Sanguibacter antarcticus]PFG32514.1 methyltransferase family protein [Sanguibacter antarcticus]